MATREYSIATPQLPFSTRTVDRVLWGLVVLTLVADLVTTLAGFQLGLVESNPVARTAIDVSGLFGLLAVKASALAVALLCRLLLPMAYRSIIPACLAVFWLLAVVLNAWLILFVAG
ncbi:DUF5658 family protein [Natrialba taiwanensis]|uniref:DUF5658 domain-containing protein n=1 Tax=Natrialba taiwanensis DSM 12281 TaxID=1230458 RepID=L9ZK59_9EURY|nr:DUF5658 family protein [Natrialba taiwanensis]ELY86431.1 hypothetical protein C484_18332 [Natrialba taiwanensis DSM 12281]